MSQLRQHLWFYPAHLEPNHMTRITYIFSRRPRTHSLTFWLPETSLYLSLSLSLSPSLAFSLSLSVFISTSRNSLNLPVSKTLLNTRNMGAHTFCDLFLTCSASRLDLFQSRTQPQKFRQIPKETNNQLGRRHNSPKIHCSISVYWYITWNTYSTDIL